VAQCVLEIVDSDEHASHFFVRDATSPRPVRKYVDRYDEIRRIQDEITRRAKRDGIPIIEGTDVNGAVTQVLDLVLAAAERVERIS
jgi:2-phosphoglycerate kinase